jgi:ribosome-associated protein
LPQVKTAPAEGGDIEKVDALHDLVLRSLDDDKAVVIASGTSTRQVAAMAQKLSERIKRDLGRNVRVEGLPVADWVLIDADDVIVHLFRPEVRSFYNLERMWAFEESAPATAAR